ncbi:MAG: DUF885 family protein [Pirellulales bacterium]
MRRRFLILLSLLLTVPSQAWADVPNATASEQFARLLDDSWQFSLRENPLNATESGDHRYDAQLPKISLADSERRNEATREFLARLEKIDRSELTPSEQTSYDIFARQERLALEAFDFGDHLMPISDRYGFHIEFPELPRNLQFNTVEDYENYIARLAAFDDYAAGHIELMREGIRRGMTLPAVIMQRFREPLEPQIVDDPEKSLLYAPLQKFPEKISAADRQRLQQAAKAAIAESVVPGYRRFLDFMTNEYVPNCRDTIAASALPNGREYYRHSARKYTTVDKLTPEEIHAIGKQEVERIRGEMDAIIKRVGFDGDFAAFTEMLRTDPKFYAKSPEELVEYTSAVLKRIDGQLPTMFGKLPRMSYGVREVPEFIAPQATFAYYQPPTGDGTRAGFFYLNTYNLPARPLYMIESLSLHEAVPGHHLQIALQQELPDLPEFRKFGGFTAFVEGWALYSERLGREMGFYTDPYSDFGRLTAEAWRACRLVVDTGIHYLGWTRDEAIEYMRQNSAMPLHDVRAEVDRYIGWPGQALGYKIGELKIRELRAKAERELGDKFDVRKFHDTVLAGGAAPLDVLERNVDAWIASSKSQRNGDSVGN